jgi:hypothetical protein
MICVTYKETTKCGETEFQKGNRLNVNITEVANLPFSTAWRYCSRGCMKILFDSLSAQRFRRASPRIVSVAFMVKTMSEARICVRAHSVVATRDIYR